MEKKCDMKICRGEALRAGRYIAELSTKTSETPIHSVTDHDLKILGARLNNMVNYCAIKSEDNKKISNLYAGILVSRGMPSGKKLASDLIELMNTLYYSNDECKCQKEEIKRE